MIKWESLLGEKMEVFLRQKWSLGYTYTSGQQTLKQFDHYVYLVEPTATTLSKHLCDGWIQSNRHLHHNTLFKKVTPIRQLGKFLSSCILQDFSTQHCSDKLHNFAPERFF